MADYNAFPKGDSSSSSSPEDSPIDTSASPEDSPASASPPSEKRELTTPKTASSSSPPSPPSILTPPKILKGWTHRSTPSPRRVAIPTSLGAIDENTPNVAPDIPQRAHHRPIARVLNFGFTPTLHASRHPPAYTEYSDVKGPNGEYLSEVRRNRTQPRRGGWFRFVIFALIPIAIIVALGVGLGVGLSRKHSSPSSGFSPTNPNNNSQQHFPEGSYSFTTFLDTVATACTPNSVTWRCYPYETYNESTTGSQTVFNWVVSSASSGNSSYQVSSSQNPFALTFGNTEMKLINANMADEAYTFSTPMQKIVVPTVSLTSDGATANCYYNNTLFQAKLYTKKAKTYPPGAQNSGNGASELFGEWPYAVEAQETISAGSGVPDCYKVYNGVLGEKIDIGTVSDGGQCECAYMNYGM